MTGQPLPEAAPSPTATDAGVPSTARPPRPRWRETLGLLARNPTAAVAATVLLLIVLMAVFDEAIAPYGPNEIAVEDRLQPPSLAHPFGTDDLGRDILSRVILGAAVSLRVGFLAVGVALVVGALIGLLAGYYGRWVDDFFNWLYSVFTSIPYLLLVLAVAAVLGQKGVLTVILILGLTGWTGIFRLVRAEYLKHRVREYVLAADAVGASAGRRMFAHILPNVSHVVLVQLSLHVVLFIKSEVILSFLGFGVGVDTVSWGSMLAEAPSELILGMWWQIAAATAAMALAVTAFSLFTDAVRDALDPRLQ
jgi:peptide/nickel transport system permease protein